MSRFDRYMLSQLMVLFGFFALVLVSLYWVNSAVALFDRLIADGQSVFVFFEFTALSLPKVISRMLPIAAFAAAVYVTNRLSQESELTVMQATGFSPWRLARPVIMFGLIITMMMAALTLVLVPTSQARLDQRQQEVSQNTTARLLTEGTFLNPGPGVTFYIREITPDGVLKDIFLSDRSQSDQHVTYTAKEAYLLKTDDVPRLIMIDGLAQIETLEDGRLFATNFADFSYDISTLISRGAPNTKRLDWTDTRSLIFSADQVAERLKLNRAWVLAELHERLMQPLMTLLAALVGFATLLIGGYSRFGVWKQIVLALILLIFLEGLKNTALPIARENEDLWVAAYLPVGVGLALSVLLLGNAARPLHLRRRLTS